MNALDVLNDIAAMSAHWLKKNPGAEIVIQASQGTLEKLRLSVIGGCETESNQGVADGIVLHVRHEYSSDSYEPPSTVVWSAKYYPELA